MPGTNVNRDNSFSVETLEPRELLSWGAYPQRMDQDDAASRYPGITGAGQTIVDIDSGVNFRHPGLSGRIWTNPNEKANGRDDDRDGLRDNIHGWDYVHDDPDPSDDQGHGTMTAGFMVANRFVNTGNSRGYRGDRATYQGIAPGAKVIPLKVVDSSLRFNIRDVESALKWTIANRSRYNITAVNLSLDVGSYGYSVIQDELKTLWYSGVFISAASGNGGTTNNRLAWPAMSPYAAAVGAMNVDGSVNWKTSRGPSLDVLAPGNNIPYLSRGVDYYAGGSGTSYAAPFAAGAAALIKQVNPRFTSDQVLDIIHDSGGNTYDARSRLTFKRLDIDSAIALALARAGKRAPAPSSSSQPPKTAPAARSALSPFSATAFSTAKGITSRYGNLSNVDSGDYVGFRGLNFGRGASVFELKLAVNNRYAGKQIQVRLGSPKGRIAGVLKTRGTGGWGRFATQSARISNIKGIQDIYLTFAGGHGVGNIATIDFD